MSLESGNPYEREYAPFHVKLVTHQLPRVADTKLPFDLCIFTEYA